MGDDPAQAATSPPGPRRPTARGMATAWAAAAVVLGAGLLIEQATRNGMDAANPIRERIGMASFSSFPVPQVSGTVAGERTAVLFVRPEQADSVCTWASEGHIDDITMVAVAPENLDCKGVPLTIDADRRLADGFGMRTPKDGGYPLGFALLDSQGGLRYTTLARDYEKRNWWDRHLYRGDRWEMQTVLKEIS